MESKNIDKDKAKRTLEEFLALPINSSLPVLQKFAALPGAIARFDGGKNNFVYIPGDREDRVVLAAHADTVWDRFYTGKDVEQEVTLKEGEYSGKNAKVGIGADDRAGCAMLWLLKDSGHSLLILDGEEHGQIGANYIREEYPEIFRIINNHNYIIQLDRRGSNDYKTYNIPVTDEFLSYVEKKSNYVDAGKNARTDIVALCKKICGVNFSVGYYNEHTPDEKLVFNEWLNTLSMVSEMIATPQPRFELAKEDLITK